MKLFLAVCLSLFSIPSFSQEESKIVQLHESMDLIYDVMNGLTIGQPAPQVPLTIVVVDGAGWDRTDLSERLKQANQIYSSQCGFRLRVSRVFDAKLSDNSYLELSNHKRMEGFEKELADLPRPLLVYTKSDHIDSRYASSNGFSCSKSFNCEPGAEGVVWIFKDGAENFKKEPNFYSADFNIEAHELAHLLGDLPHIEAAEQNILSKKGFNNTIPKDFCEKFRLSPYLQMNSVN